MRVVIRPKPDPFFHRLRSAPIGQDDALMFNGSFEMSKVSISIPPVINSISTEDASYREYLCHSIVAHGFYAFKCLSRIITYQMCKLIPPYNDDNNEKRKP